MDWPLPCIRTREPLSNHTSFRIGGPAEWFAEPTNVDELLQLLREASQLGIPVSIVGGGTNTLVADRGVRGLVIHLSGEFRHSIDVSHPDDPLARVSCGAALLTQRLVFLGAKYGWDGLEAFAGLPGQLGGAVAMNAQDIGRFIRRVRLVSYDGVVKDLPREMMRFQYRYTAFESGILVQAELEFPKIPAEEAYGRIQRALAYRNSTQDLRLPSAGCAFKNPPGMSAGRVIDQAGLKGVRIGDAQVSLRHANFIVNLGSATCDDVLSLMEHVQQRVRRTVGVLLEPEVRLIGERLR